MEENKHSAPDFGIRKEASLTGAVTKLEEFLSWKEIELIPDNSFNFSEFDPLTDSRVEIMAVKPPGMTRSSLMSYAKEYDEVIFEKIQNLVKHSDKLHQKRIELLLDAHNCCYRNEAEYDMANPFRFAFHIRWFVTDQKGERRKINFDALAIPQQVRDEIIAEFDYRRAFFEWIRKEILVGVEMLESFEIPDPLVIWNTLSPELKLTEIITAMEKQNVLVITGKSKDIFFRKLENLFGLKEFDWVQKRADIMNRKAKYKYTFCIELAGLTKIIKKLPIF